MIFLNLYEIYEGQNLQLTLTFFHLAFRVTLEKLCEVAERGQSGSSDSVLFPAQCGLIPREENLLEM